MDILLLGLIAIVLLVIVLLIVYLTSRVNGLEKETLAMASKLTETALQSATTQGPFAGLSGQALWDAMCGNPTENLDTAHLDAIRQRYEQVLTKHIQSLFDEGVRDAQRGMSGEPKNPRNIQTSQGQVESWLPSAQVNTLYKAGMDTVQFPADQWQPVRQALDEAGQLLFAKVQIELSEPLSQALLPQAAPAGLPGPDSGGADNSPAPSPASAPKT